VHDVDDEDSQVAERGPARPEVREALVPWFWALGFEFRVWDFGLRVEGFGLRAEGFGFRVSGLGFQVSGFGFRV
jgi:hypothetical protein